MSEPVQSPTQQLIDGLDLEALAQWLEQRVGTHPSRAT